MNRNQLKCVIIAVSLLLLSAISIQGQQETANKQIPAFNLVHLEIGDVVTLVGSSTELRKMTELFTSL